MEDRVDALGNTLLHIAAMRTNVDLVVYLLENDFDINALNNNNQTALVYNIASFGPDINWNNPITEGEATARINFISDMPLFHDPVARRTRRAHIGSMLIDAGINMNQQDVFGWTILHFAAGHWGAATVEFFIEQGADQYLKTNYGRTAADILALRN